MLNWRTSSVLPILLLAALLLPVIAGAQEESEYREYIYATHGGVPLRALVLEPDGEGAASGRAAAVIVHGGGWAMGEPEWGIGRAQTFVDLGLVGISIQYRLSDPGTGVTPLEAMADVRAAIRWVRSNAAELGIAPDRIAAYGWSAGAHLLAMAAILHDVDEGEAVSCVPDALILSSPAVWVSESTWVAELLGNRGEPADISPDLLVRVGMPPTLMLQGRTDTVTPLVGTQRFHDAMIAAGNSSALQIYDGVGHLFTPSSEPDDGWPNPDPETRAAAFETASDFLRSLGFVD